MDEKLRGLRNADGSETSSEARCPLRPTVRCGAINLLVFLLSITLAAANLLPSLAEFPAFFHSDEARPVSLGERLLGCGGGDDNFRLTAIPLVVEWTDNRLDGSIAALLHGAVTCAFGRSVFTARVTTAMMTLLAFAVLAIYLKVVWVNRFWAVFPLTLSLMPSTILTSRTGIGATSPILFFCIALLLHHRGTKGAWWAAPLLTFVVALGGLSYSAYFPAGVVFLLLLLISDRKTLFRSYWSLVLTLLLIAALLGRIAADLGGLDFVKLNLSSIDSVATKPELAIYEKAGQVAETYISAFDPEWWISDRAGAEGRAPPNIVWHGLPNFSRAAFPIFVIGALIVACSFSQSRARALTLLFLCVPIGPALDTIEVRRIQLLYPLSGVYLVITMEAITSWLERRGISFGAAFWRLIVLCALLYATVTIYSHRDAELVLRPSDEAYRNNPLAVRKVFEQFIPSLPMDNVRTVLVSSVWANRVDYLVDFYSPLSRGTRIEIGHLSSCLTKKCVGVDESIFVALPHEIEQARESGMVHIQGVGDSVRYPETGAVFLEAVAINYPTDFYERVKQVEWKRNQLRAYKVSNDRYSGEVRLPELSAGQPADLFDGDSKTLIRGISQNPFTVVLVPSGACETATLKIQIGSMQNGRMCAEVIKGRRIRTKECRDLVGMQADPTIEFRLISADQGDQIRLSTSDLDRQEAMIHIREISIACDAPKAPGG